MLWTQISPISSVLHKIGSPLIFTTTIRAVCVCVYVCVCVCVCGVCVYVCVCMWHVCVCVVKAASNTTSGAHGLTSWHDQPNVLEGQGSDAARLLDPNHSIAQTGNGHHPSASGGRGRRSGKEEKKERGRGRVTSHAY